jgi:hypothetical protein
MIAGEYIVEYLASLATEIQKEVAKPNSTAC